MRKLFLIANFASVGIFLLSIAYGHASLAALAFLLSAVTSTNHQHGVLAVCVTTCELLDITSSDDCNVRGGLKTVYWAKYSDIDWAAMAADPLKFDQTNQEILGYTMVGAAVFKKLTFDRKQGKYDFTYESENDLYNQVITMIFEGKSRDIRNAFVKAVGCCKLILHIFDNNCLERVVGVEWDGSTFEPQVTPLRIIRHLDSSGEFGSSKARDEVDIGGESVTAPLFANVGEANMPV